MSTMSPAERTLRARTAAHTLHAQGGTNTKPARAARWEGFLDEVDPDRILSEEERNRRARHAEQAHMSRLSFQAAKARRKKAEARRRERGGLASDNTDSQGRRSMDMSTRRHPTTAQTGLEDVATEDVRAADRTIIAIAAAAVRHRRRFGPSRLSLELSPHHAASLRRGGWTVESLNDTKLAGVGVSVETMHPEDGAVAGSFALIADGLPKLVVDGDSFRLVAEDGTATEWLPDE